MTYEELGLNLDRALDHIQGCLWYWPWISYGLKQRTPRKHRPAFGVILDWQKKTLRKTTTEDLDLMIQGRIEWVTNTYWGRISAISWIAKHYSKEGFRIPRGLWF